MNEGKKKLFIAFFIVFFSYNAILGLAKGSCEKSVNVSSLSCLQWINNTTIEFTNTSNYFGDNNTNFQSSGINSTYLGVNQYSNGSQFFNKTNDINLICNKTGIINYTIKINSSDCGTNQTYTSPSFDNSVIDTINDKTFYKVKNHIIYDNDWKKNCTGYTDGITFIEDTCEQIVYSGVRFINESGTWKAIENANSLKSVWLPFYIKTNDTYYKINFTEYNYKTR